MRLAVSDIAWAHAQDPGALDELARLGVDGVEVAPTIVWPGWDGATPAAAARYRREVEARGLTCSSMQAILFGRPDLTLFGDDSVFRNLRAHLAEIAGLAATLGAGAVVFGAPANRARGALDPASAMRLAAERFAAIGDDFAASGVVLCIEPNPPEYGCDFVTTAAEAVELARLADSAGFGVHLDAGALVLSGADVADAIGSSAAALRHFHISQPHLGTFDDPEPAHPAIGEALRSVTYRGWYAIEMRSPGEGLGHLAPAVALARRAYGDPSAP